MKIFLTFFFITSITCAKANFFIPKQETEVKQIKQDKIRPQATVYIQKNNPAKAVSQQQKKQDAEFIKIFNEYQQDIKKIADTGEFVETSQIQKDFEGMHTNDKFLVE